jgi:putative ABC transport system permease protein
MSGFRNRSIGLRAPDQWRSTGRRARLFRLPLALLGLAGLTLRRLWSRPALTLLALLGIVLAVGLLTSAAFFSHAVDLVILRQELDELSRETGRSPFTTRVYTLPSSREPLTLAEAEQMAERIATTLSAEVGLPLARAGLYAESGSMMLQPRTGDSRFGQNSKLLGTTGLVYIDGVAGHMQIVAGEPLDAGASQAALDVWMHTRMAEQMGIHAGELLDVGLTLRHVPIAARVRGLWRARDPADPFWFNDPDTSLDELLLVRRQDYVDRVEPMIASGIGFAAWHVALDDRAIEPERARGYAFGFERSMVTIAQWLPDAKLDVSPLDSLKQYQQRETTLTTLLLGFQAPALGFLLYFLVLTSAIIARWQRQETATMVSRGMGMSGIVTTTVIEELLLFVAGYPLGILFGMLIARLMGDTTSFLTFADRQPLPVSLHGANTGLTLMALAIALCSRLWPVVRAARQSVVLYEREHARPPRSPFWQRSYLDILLLIPAVYAYQQLRQRGTIAALVRDRPEDLYRDPLLILVPALFVLAAALLAMRVFPLLMRLLDGVACRIGWATPYLALRQLSRQSQSYTSPLLLVIVSLALGVYSSSMAASLDQWLADRMAYRVGADVAFRPYHEAAAEALGGDWIPPIGEFRDLPGVAAATRVGEYPVDLTIGGRRIAGRFLAIDRLDFPAVAFFRPDFADESLGGLLNQLASAPEGILVSERLLAELGLKVGDQLPLTVAVDAGVGFSSNFVIVGTYRYFPTVYEDRVTVIGDMEYLFSSFGYTFPHNIWLRLADGAGGQAVLAAVPKTGVEAAQGRAVGTLIAGEQAKIERAGIFGTLTVGFLAAAAMAIVGMLIHGYASLRERLYRFAVLHAIGLTRRQLARQIAIEHSVLSAYGAAAGALIGALVSWLYTPFFRVTGERGVPLPPLVPAIPQEQIAWMALAFGAAMIALELAVVAWALRGRRFRMSIVEQ